MYVNQLNIDCRLRIHHMTLSTIDKPDTCYSNDGLKTPITKEGCWNCSIHACGRSMGLALKL